MLTDAQRTQPIRLLLDYDGTLVPIARSPELAAPDAEVLTLLGDLANAPGLEVDLVSGRARATLAAWFAHLPVSLGAEHGFWHRPASSQHAFVGSLLIAITTSLPEIVVSLSAVRIGAIDLGVGNVLGSNLFNLLILGLDDVWYRQGPLLADVGPGHSVAVLAIVIMNGLFLAGLTCRVMTKRFAVAWDTAAIAAVYVVAVGLGYALGASSP